MAVQTIEEQIGVRFANDTQDHALTILRDDGLYRHIRMNKPGTYIYGYDVVTWPGYLAIVGDAGSFVFQRIDDMFEFFMSSGGRTNAHYWSEKLQAPDPDAVRVYSWESFVIAVQDHTNDAADYYGLDDDELERFKQDVQEQILDSHASTEGEAYRLLAEFDSQGHRIEPYEFRFRDWDRRFLWCCYAIVLAIVHYRAARGDD